MSTVGIVHCGELGAALAPRFSDAGVEVLVTVDGRTEATQARAKTAPATVVAGLADIVARADVIISVVQPEAAVAVAEECAAAARQIDRASPLYVDVNSIGAASAHQVEQAITEAGLRYVGGAVRGGAGRLDTDGVIYLSGADRHTVAELLESAMPTLDLGPDPAAAKHLKLLVGGISKSFSMLYLELAIAASKVGLYDGFRSEVADFYPSLDALFERFIPTFPRHVDRRAVEAYELATLADQADVPTTMLQTSSKTMATLAEHLKTAEATSLDEVVSRVVKELDAADVATAGPDPTKGIQ